MEEIVVKKGNIVISKLDDLNLQKWKENYLQIKNRFKQTKHSVVNIADCNLRYSDSDIRLDGISSTDVGSDNSPIVHALDVGNHISSLRFLNTNILARYVCCDSKTYENIQSKAVQALLYNLDNSRLFAYDPYNQLVCDYVDTIKDGGDVTEVFERLKSMKELLLKYKSLLANVTILFDIKTNHDLASYACGDTEFLDIFYHIVDCMIITHKTQELTLCVDSDSGVCRMLSYVSKNPTDDPDYASVIKKLLKYTDITVDSLISSKHNNSYIKFIDDILIKHDYSISSSDLIAKCELTKASGDNSLVKGILKEINNNDEFLSVDVQNEWACFIPYKNYNEGVILNAFKYRDIYQIVKVCVRLKNDYSDIISVLDPDLIKKYNAIPKEAFIENNGQDLARLFFYYGDLFTLDELKTVDISLLLPLDLTKNDQENAKDYFKRIDVEQVSKGMKKILHIDFFSNTEILEDLFIISIAKSLSDNPVSFVSSAILEVCGYLGNESLSALFNISTPKMAEILSSVCKTSLSKISIDKLRADYILKTQPIQNDLLFELLQVYKEQHLDHIGSLSEDFLIWVGELDPDSPMVGDTMLPSLGDLPSLHENAEDAGLRNRFDYSFVFSDLDDTLYSILRNVYPYFMSDRSVN